MAGSTKKKTAEQRIVELKERRDAHEKEGQEIVDTLDEEVRAYLDDNTEAKGPTYLAELLGLTRSRVYQLRDRGREKAKARAQAEKAAARRAARAAKRAEAKAAAQTKA